MKPISFSHLSGVLLAITLLAWGMAPAPAQESVSVLLQKGLFAEETEGDLQAAIAIYNDIVKQTDQSRAVAAQALYRLSLCHLKLGDKEKAQASLNKLVEEYTDQESLVALAKKQLEAPKEKPENQVVARRVWKDAINSIGRVSPDGVSFAYVDWNTGNLAVRNLTEAESRPLTGKKDWNESDDYAGTPVWAPDGTAVAFTWFNMKKDETAELRIISMDGGDVRTVDSGFGAGAYLELFDWSPDGSRLVGVVWKKEEKRTQLVLIHPTDGSVRYLKDLGKASVSNARFSPNASYVAYDRSSESGRLEMDIVLIELESAKETNILRHRANETVMEWLQDDILMFKSDRGGGEALWTAKIEGENLANEPRLLRVGFNNAFSLGLTIQGDFYYGIYAGGAALRRAVLDLESGRLLSHPSTLAKDPLRMTLAPKGTSLAFWTSQKGHSARPKLVWLDLETEAVRELWTPTDDQRVGQPVVSNDHKMVFQRFRFGYRDPYSEQVLIDVETGKRTELAKDGLGGSRKMKGRSAARFSDDSLLYMRGDLENERILAVRRDLKTGEEKQFLLVEKPDPERFHSFSIRSDLEAVFYRIQGEDVSAEDPAIVYQLFLKSGTKEELIRRDHAIRMYPSPDSGYLALGGDLKEDPYPVSLLELTTGKPQVKWKAELPGTPTMGGAWTPDGRYLLLNRGSGSGESSERNLWCVAADDGKTRKTELSDRFTVGRFFVHPDGQQIVYRAFLESLSEVWRMDNFLESIGE